MSKFLGQNWEDFVNKRDKNLQKVLKNKSNNSAKFNPDKAVKESRSALSYTYVSPSKADIHAFILYVENEEHRKAREVLREIGD